VDNAAERSRTKGQARGRIVLADRARVQMRMRAGDADQESDDAGLRVAETKLHATFVTGTFIMIVAPASRRRFSFVIHNPVVGCHGNCE
jgi:hypothetical protein